MNGLNFFLMVNFVVAMSFCMVFVVVSSRSRSRSAARWIAAGFAIASLSTIFELLVAHTEWVKPWAILAFASVLAGLILLRIGVARLYNDPVSLKGAALLFVVCCFGDLLIYDLPRGTVWHSFAYQAPFALCTLASAVSVLRAKRKLAIDWALVVLLLFTAAHFVAKAALAVLVGAGSTAADYITTDYAIISQSSTGIMIVMTGLTLLSVLVLEIMADERFNSEVDALSSLLNRRGFEKSVNSLLREGPRGPHAVIMCDLDHFKNINDTFGHHCGDAVIQTVGQLLRTQAPSTAVVGRLGGEEFAIFLPRTPLDTAVLLAEALRASIAYEAISGLPTDFRTSASFGVAAFDGDANLSATMRNADMALYQAKGAGRNCVRRATLQPPALSIVASEAR
jgi:diguanylate cyclase (GGDEF)-like protein